MPIGSVDMQLLLEGWQTDNLKRATNDHLELISIALGLIRLYGRQTESVGISEKIYELTLATLESGDAKRVILIKGWLIWLHREVVSEDDEAPTAEVTLPMRVAIGKVEEEMKGIGGISDNPSDILRGGPGVDARVITKGSNNSWNVSKDAKVTRTFGAQFTGNVPSSGFPVYAGVQLASRGDRFDVQGQLLDHAGAQIGVPKRSTWISQANMAVDGTKDLQTLSSSYGDSSHEPAPKTPAQSFRVNRWNSKR